MSMPRFSHRRNAIKALNFEIDITFGGINVEALFWHIHGFSHVADSMEVLHFVLCL